MGRILVAGVVLCMAGLAFAIDPNGRPEGLEPGKLVRWYLWHTEKGWHLRTTTKMQEHHFEGKITVKGGKVRDVHVSQGDKKIEKNDSWKLSNNDRVLTIDFKTKGGMDGFDFGVGGKADEIEFSLKIDGKDEPKHIFIGKGNEHPESATFTLPAKP